MPRKKKETAKSNPNTEITLNTTPVFEWNFEAYQQGKKFIINQGGARSGKSYAILQVLIWIALNNKVTISIIRKTLPSLKATAMKDFFEILNELKIYNPEYHNLTESNYTFPQTGSEVEFFALDDEHKVRGRKRDVAYLNECDAFNLGEFIQINMRTSGSIFIDFNPSDSEHFIYDYMNKKNAILIKSTYKDNTFLPQSQVDEIEDLINVDENAYRIFALGERPMNETKIYNHFQKYVDEPEYTDWCYGLDFGHTHPMALVKVMYGKDDKVYIKQMIYESKLTITALIEKMNLMFGDADRAKPIYCDYSRPEMIDELKKNGFNAKIANKSVKDGLDYVKGTKIYVHVDSLDIWKEYKLYMYKSIGNKISEEPIKENDDALDAIRYALYTRKKRNNSKGNFEIIFI